jgi:hypothetical protein
LLVETEKTLVSVDQRRFPQEEKPVFLDDLNASL